LPLVGGADEVFVGAASARVLGVQESARAPRVAAFATEEEPLQVVKVHDVTGAIALSRVEHRLHFEEGLLGDEGLVASDVELALVPVDTRVIRVAQDGREAARADCLRCVARRGARLKPLSFEQPLEAGDRVAPRGVLLERPGHQWAALGIDVDGVH